MSTSSTTAREGDGRLGRPNEKPMTSRPLTRTLTLGPLTALALAPPQLFDVAAAAGLDGIGIRMLPAAPGGIAYRLMDDAAMLRETLAAKAATGLRILDLEMVRIGPAFDVSVYAAFFDTGARLGAAHVLVAIDDTDTARAAASFAQVCEALQPYGITADVEFMPWTGAPDLDSIFTASLDFATRITSC